ncbi:MAG TPA: sulfurtransferase [Steroidobacteraceae bacterium]|nr:sulfurtransferase [Steroidobacteraceae bacterium]
MTMSFTTLVEPAELAAHLSDPRWITVDCRFELTDPAAGARLYAAGHIPGARYAHLDHDLSSPMTATTGRHPLPDANELARRLGEWGIEGSSQVVAYDEANGAMAARLWWLLRWLGHGQVAVLNGGLRAWRAAGYPLSDQSPVVTPRVFTPRIDPDMFLDVDAVARRVAAHEIVLVDARPPDRFAGRNETLDPVAGHVPGARNHPFARNVDAAGRFLSAEQLREAWRPTLASAAGDRVVSMCGSGVTACHNLLALEIAGVHGARLYPGSWSEWIRDPKRPVASGASGD